MHIMNHNSPDDLESLVLLNGYGELMSLNPDLKKSTEYIT